MKKQNALTAKTATSKKAKTSLAKMSTQKPPTEAEIAKAVAATKPLPGDIAKILSLEIVEEVDKYEPIVFSDTWYEFSGFVETFRVHPKTAGKWLDKGWLAYSLLGKLRFINKFDIEDMMLRFRKPAILGLGYMVSLVSDWNTWGFFCESL